MTVRDLLPRAGGHTLCALGITASCGITQILGWRSLAVEFWETVVQIAGWRSLAVELWETVVQIAGWRSFAVELWETVVHPRQR